MHTLLKALILTVLLMGVCGLEVQKHAIGRTFLRTNPIYSLDDEETRRRKDHYFIYPYYGWHALTWIYWIKVKLVVVAFFAYTAFIWALRYMEEYYNKCQHTGHQVYYDHGHYRSFSDLEIPKTLQTYTKERRKKNINS